MLAGVAIIVILANLGPVFALLGKDLTMTGRTRLWWYVLDEFVARQPLLGHGFNALWGDHAFQQAAAARLNFIPVIGDNGFLDVLLNLGLVGLALFLALYFLAWRRAFRLLAAVRTPAAVAPLVVMGFSFFGNLSYSFLLEIELFVWGMMVAIIFARPSPGAPAQ
jgi:O-antigen ligase